MAHLSRRDFIVQTALAASASTLVSARTFGQTPAAAPAADALPPRAIQNGRLNQAVSPWIGQFKGLDRLCAVAAALGLRGIDLLGPHDWPTLQKHGLLGTMTPTHSLTKGLNRKENHEVCLESIRKAIEATSDAGFPNVICFSGNANEDGKPAITPEEGLQNCADALKQVIGLAEKKKVTLCMELLNSKVNHKDYMCDNTRWGVALCKAVGSENFKLLYDIYHMGVMGEDIIATVKEFHPCFGHYHTAGVPGRHEIDSTQTLNYPEIMKAIAATHFKGYIAHEFSPQHDPMKSLTEAIKICDV